MFSGKKINFDGWIVQIEKVYNLTGKPEHVLTLAKSSGTSYKMISQTPSNTTWSELKNRLQEVYSLVATDIHAATDLLRKQYANELLQDYIAYCTEMCHRSMKDDPVNIDNELVIFLFIKNLYNRYKVSSSRCQKCEHITGCLQDGPMEPAQTEEIQRPGVRR